MRRGQVVPPRAAGPTDAVAGRHARMAAAGSLGVVRAGDRRGTRHLCVGADAASRWSGSAGYDPRMLLGLLVYGYCQGVRSSRQIERMCLTDVAFRVLCAQDGPDHATIARFRADAQEAFTDLFSQVLMIAARTGLGRFGTVAIDGTKIRANASLDANRGRDWFDQHVAGMVADANRTDDAENAAAVQSPDDHLLDRVPSDLVACR